MTTAKKAWPSSSIFLLCSKSNNNIQTIYLLPRPDSNLHKLDSCENIASIYVVNAKPQEIVSLLGCVIFLALEKPKNNKKYVHFQVC
jgi:hypothetical protein